LLAIGDHVGDRTGDERREQQKPPPATGNAEKLMKIQVQ
jgi:hypothetical protein